ncbi:hypothetical protein ABPG73_022594 [Tetrahymena malaccensis]
MRINNILIFFALALTLLLGTIVTINSSSVNEKIADAACSGANQGFVDYIGVQGASSVESQHYDSSTDKILPDFEGLKPNECYKKAGIQFTCAPFLPYGIGNCNIPTEFIYDSSSQNKKITKYYLRVGFTHRKDQFDQYASFNIKVNNNQVQPTKKEEKGCDNYKWTIIFLQYNLEEQLYKISITISTNLPQNVNYSISDIVFIVDFTPNCDQSCKTCSGLSQNQCIICKDKKYISVRLGNICTDICDVNKTEFEDALTNKDQKYCRQCLTSCKTCSKQNTCDSCFEKQFLDSNNLCSPCHPDCQTYLSKLLGGGGVCFSSSSKKNEVDNPSKKQKNIRQIHNLKNDEYFKETSNQNQQIEEKESNIEGDIDDFSNAYKQYFNKNAVVNTVKKNLIASQVRKIIEKAIYDNREEIIYQNIREKLRIYEWANTLVIVTSRLDKISVSDARVYFNYYDQEGKEDNDESYVSMKLEKFTDSDIKDYFNKFQQYVKIANQNQRDIDQIKEVIFQNSNLIQLAKLPVNLYLTTRMMSDLDLKDNQIVNDLKSASDQVDIQELFFQQQFSKKAKEFLLKLKIKEKTMQNNIENLVKQTYFEYFQNIAMQMFLQKESKSNFLSTNKNVLHFEIKNEINKFLNKDQIQQLNVLLNQYVDSRVITRVNLSNQNSNSMNNQQNEDFEFRHKSIFEYFAARSMKYDFDLHQENIHKLPFDKLIQFNINQKPIMNIGYNKSEQQILLKLFKLIDHSKQICNYQENYISEDIEKNNRYFQYLRRSQIDSYDKISKIDIGASNLLSALFVSRFAFDRLTLRKCSFSKSYISYKNNQKISFDECNLNNALLKQVNPSSIESSLTQDSIFDSYQKIFSSDSFQNFKKIIFFQEKLVSINDNGYINCFKQSTQDYKYELSISKKITNCVLNQIKIYGENQLVVSSLSTLFLIDSIDFSIKKMKKFDQKIINFDCQSSYLLVQLDDDKNYYGRFEQGLKEVDFLGQFAKLSKNCVFIAASIENQLIIYQVNNQFQRFKTLDNHSDYINSIEFSDDGKLMISTSNKELILWSLEKNYEQIKIIQDSEIESVAISRDGKYIATGYIDKFYKIWQRKEEEIALIEEVQYEKNQLLSVAFDEKKDIVALGSKINCRVYDIQTKLKKMQIIEGHSQRISSVVFSPNGQYLATGSVDSTCKIWKIISNQNFMLFKVLEGHSGEVCSVTFSSDNKYLATSSQDKTVKIWELERQFQLIHTLQDHSLQVTQLAFSNDNKYLATVSYDKTCRIWSCQKDFHIVKIIQDYTRELTTVAFSGDSKYLATGSYEKTCKIFDVERDFTIIKTLQDHTSIIAQVKFSKDGRYLATCSYDNTCKIWSVKKQFHLIKTIDGHKERVYQISFSEDSKYLASGSMDGTCKVWDVDKQFKLVNSIQHEGEEVTSVSFSYDNQQLAISSFNILNIYNAQNRIESINEIEGHTQEITSVAFSNNGKYIATSSLDQTCKIWNIENGFYLQKTIQDHTDMITCIAFSNNDKYFATTSFDQTCRIWDIQKGFEQINLIQGETNLLFCVAFSPDSKYLAIGYMDYYCQVFDINQGFKLNHTLQDEACSVASLSFSSDGKYFSIGSDDNTCKIWDSSNNFSLLHTMQDHESVVNSVCFSPDCKYFVTGCLDKTFKIWNIQKDFQLIHTIHREESGNNEIILSSFYIDSRHLLTCSQGNICEVWDVEQNFKLVNIIEENNTEINQISISSDGNYLAIAFQDSTCKLLDAKKAFQQIYSQNLNSAGLIQQKECEPKKSQIKQHKGQNFFENIYTF